MNCPNCGNADYTAPDPCPVCQWEPGSDCDPAENVTPEQPTEDSEHMMNLMAAIGFGVLFFVLFYIFPSKRQGDWFHFQIWDVVGGAVLSVIGFYGLEKVKD